MADRLHVLIHGRVQGVGFRYATHRQAALLDLNGWVKNLYDGGVEAEFEGPRDRLDTMLEWCRVGPAYANVTHVDASWESGPPRHEHFSIRG